MPSYEVEIPGQGVFEVESDKELNNDEVIKAVQSQLGASQPTSNQNYFERTGRRVNEAVDAFTDIPKSAYNLVTGGDKGRLDAGLRLVQGAAAPINTLLAPIEGAVEDIAAKSGVSEPWAELGGDLGGMVGTLGLGLLSKAGKLGPYAEQFAKVLGVGRPVNSLTEQLKHDSQLRYAAGLDDANKQGSALERAVRDPRLSLEDLALRAKAPIAARHILEEKSSANKSWQEFAKQNIDPGAMPKPSSYSPDDIISFQPTPGSDVGVLGTLGTPAHVAANRNYRAVEAMYEVNLAEMRIKEGVNARDLRNKQALAELSDDDIYKGVKEAQLDINLNKQRQPKVKGKAIKALSFIENKYNIDRAIISERLIGDLEAKATAKIDAIKNKPSYLTSDILAVEDKLNNQKKRIANMNFSDLLAEIFPSYHEIRGPKGLVEVIKTNKQNARDFLEELIKERPDLKDKLTIKSTAFLDSDLLGIYKGRFQRAVDNLAKGVSFTKEELMAAQDGKFISSKFNPFGALRDARGKGYRQDLTDLMAVYDRQIEKFTVLKDLEKRINPIIKELRVRDYDKLADLIQDRLIDLRGYRMPLSERLDNTISTIPGLRNVLGSHVLERGVQAAKSLYITANLTYNPRFHAVNSLQTLATLWPIASTKEMLQAFKLRTTKEGRELLAAHGIDLSASAGKLLDVSKPSNYLGENIRKATTAVERFNQEMAFLTMYNKARMLGLDDTQAAAYGKLRGNVFSQFMGLTTDMPAAFRKYDQTGMITMFQRFNVKQIELLTELIKDRNFPGAAKWLATNLILGGFKGATLGAGGWLTYETYQQIKNKYGEQTADVFHLGLPAIAGVDLSNSVQLFNPPFGESWPERIGNMLAGPIGSLSFSLLNAANAKNAVEPIAAKRVFDALINRTPLFKSVDRIGRLFSGDYDLKDPLGRLRYKAEAKDLFKQFLGFRPSGGGLGTDKMRDAELDTFADAIIELEQRRQDAINFAASRYGQAAAAGIDLGPDVQKLISREIDKWNVSWPEFPITGLDINRATQRRQQTALKDMRERMMKQAPTAIRRSESFNPTYELPFPTGGN